MNKITVPYVAGFDAGGTKTKVTLMGLDRSVFLSFEGGGMNVNSFGPEQTKANLKAMLHDLNAMDEGYQHLQGWSIGTAGMSNPVTVETILQGAHESGLYKEPLMRGDQVAAFWGAHAGEDGIILIAGTGSVCYGQKGTLSARSGGFGHLIDDEGSGYALGRDVLSCVVRSADHRNPPTVMQEAVFQQLGITDASQIVPFVYSPSTTKKEIAALAPIIMKGYEAKEEAAAKVLSKAAKELAMMVAAVKEQLDLQEGNVALCGSVLQKNAVLKEMVSQKIKEETGMNTIDPKQDAAYGACLMALSGMSNEWGRFW